MSEADLESPQNPQTSEHFKGQALWLQACAENQE